MNPYLLTDWARAANPARTIAIGQDEIIKATHDILALAATKGWNATLVYPAITYEFCDERTAEVTGGISLALSIDKILKAGGHVRLTTTPITEDENGEMATSIRNLVRSYHVGHPGSPLTIETSEDKAFNRKFPRFVMAYPDDRSEGVLCVVMGPYNNSETLQAYLLTGKDGVKIGRRLLRLYEEKIGNVQAIEQPVLC